jgi:gliding motility-associated lipoprotein GldD
MKKIFLFSTFIILFSCKNEVVPKPKGQLSLEYPTTQYEELVTNANFTFQKNKIANISQTANGGLQINYPKMKAAIYLTYKPVQNNIDKLLTDAQKLTYDHVIKADNIAEQPYLNSQRKVYGMFYQVGGNAATNAQFYATDSTKNFLVASLYFYAKPNFDSILPAADYIKSDMKQMMETLRWK